MAVSSDGSSKQIKGRMSYGTSGRKRRSSIARSSISGGSWDQGSLPLSLRQASFNNATRVPSAAKFRHSQKMRLARPTILPGRSRANLALNQCSEQVRPFDAFVDIPSPFAKQKIVAKSHGYHNPTASTTDRQNVDTSFTDTRPTSIPDFNRTFPPPSPYRNLSNECDLIPDNDMNPDRASQRTEGYLDARTRSANLQHTRPEWTTWDFVDLFLSNLPPRIRTVDIWNNFKKEGEVDLIDIFVTRGGQKDNKGRLRFR
jgi:hypothetical protein